MGLVEESGDDEAAPTLGIVGFVGLCSRVGALGSRTGSVSGRSLCLNPPVHPETISSVPAIVAKQAVFFISRLLRECMIGNQSVPAHSIADDQILRSGTWTA
jgi:hypothetical protein